jgi:hypothetical protein
MVWRSAVRQLANHLPWIVLPRGGFCTAGIHAVLYRNAALPKKAVDHDEGTFFHRIPGLPENVTCLGATDTWLAPGALRSGTTTAQIQGRSSTTDPAGLTRQAQA